MSSDDEQKEYDVRSIGSLALGKVLNQARNIKIVEKYIHKKANKSDELYKRILYQTIGDLMEGIDLKVVVTNIKKDMVGWDHPTFKDVKNRIDENDDFIVNPFEVEEGVTTCHCGSGRVFTYQKQCRGSDEPMTTFAKCVVCKKQWSYSG